MEKSYTKSIGNKMPELVKCLSYAITFFGNAITNKIPIRHLRSLYYKAMGAKLRIGTIPYRCVEVLLPMDLELGDQVAVGWFAEFDYRGGITIDYDTNISSHVKPITGSHDIDNSNYTVEDKSFHIGHHCWSGTGVNILQGINIGDVAVATAGTMFAMEVPAYTVVLGGLLSA